MEHLKNAIPCQPERIEPFTLVCTLHSAGYLRDLEFVRIICDPCRSLFLRMLIHLVIFNGYSINLFDTICEPNADS